MSKNIDKLVEEKMYSFAEMCAKKGDSDSIIFSSSAFGDSPREVMLLGAAIKYACNRGWNMMITFDGDVTIR